MKLIRINKRYIGKVEAYELCLDSGHDLPRKNQEIIHSRQVGLQSDVIGKDQAGYYTEDISVKGIILI